MAYTIPLERCQRIEKKLGEELATKADILVLRSEMLAIQGKLEGEIKVTREEIKIVR
jgi:hypothetical protein